MSPSVGRTSARPMQKSQCILNRAAFAWSACVWSSWGGSTWNRPDPPWTHPRIHPRTSLREKLIGPTSGATTAAIWRKKGAYETLPQLGRTHLEPFGPTWAQPAPPPDPSPDKLPKLNSGSTLGGRLVRRMALGRRNQYTSIARKKQMQQASSSRGGGCRDRSSSPHRGEQNNDTTEIPPRDATLIPGCWCDGRMCSRTFFRALQTPVGEEKLGTKNAKTKWADNTAKASY